MRVVVYSDNRVTRNRVVNAVGCRPDVHLGPVEFVEVATAGALMAVLDAGGIDLAILDGEATPVGGLGAARQLKDEVRQCPPLLAMIARDADRWLASWSRADATVGPHWGPTELADSVIGLLRAVTPLVRTAR